MSWQRIRGHDDLVELFDRAVRRGRLGHAYLFTGPPGIGKRLFAGELAKALLCENPPAARLAACDRCPACLQVEGGTHPDLIVASVPEGKHEWPIKAMRDDVLEPLSLKPARGRRKVAILDDVELFNDETANCFLKTLEEPPPESVLLLVSSKPDRQLPTIVSRCQVVRFAPLSEAMIADLLRDEEIADPQQADRLARLSGGSPGLARALADPGLWEFRQKLLRALTATPVDSVGLGRQWTQFVEEAGKDTAAQRRRAALAVRLLIEFLRDALAVELGGRPRLDDPEDLRAVEALRKRADPDGLLQLLERCLEAAHQIERYVQLVLVLEALLDGVGQRLA
jgi:DNA polymerase-3 subunit delta'